MAWAKATIQIHPASIGTGIKVSLRQTKKAAAAMTIVITDATAKRLGWSDKDGIEIMMGEGEHHGLIRLRKNKSAAQVELERRETGKGAWFSLKLGHQAAFVDRSEVAAWCQWEQVEEGWIELVLPKWADETAPNRRRAAEAPKLQTAIGAPARAAVSVTASLMGDPPPGRREAVEKISRKEALDRIGSIKA